MSAMTYLSKHPMTGVYRYRRFIPPELREAIGRGREWHETLRTKNVREAKQLISIVAQRVDEAFDRARREIAPSVPVATVERTVTTPEAELFAAWWLYDRMADDKEWRMDGGDPDGDGEDGDYDDILSDIYGRVLQGLEDFPRRGSLRIVAKDIDDICERHGIAKLKKGTPSYNRIGFELLRTMQKWLELVRDRNAGDYSQDAPKPTTGTPMKATPAPTTGDDGTATISAMLAGWLRETQPRPRTAEEWNTVVRRWTELHGDTRVGTITRPMVAKFKDTLLQLPRNPSHKVRALPILELIAHPTATPASVKKVSGRAVNKQLTAIKSILNYAVANGQLENNPARGITAAVPRKSEDEERKTFTDDQVCMILSAALEQKSACDKWLPWLAALMGARRDEMATALVEHFGTEDGIPFLRFTDAGEGRSIKTHGSRRKMPIHPMLIRLGFLEYVKSLPKGGPLFPDMGTTSAYSQRFARLLDRIGLDDPGLVFHSWRHTFVTASRRVKMDEEIREYLVGHAPANVGRGYGEQDMTVLAEAVATIGYRGLDDAIKTA